MARFRLLSLVAIGLVGAFTLGGLAMFARQTPASEFVVPSAFVFAILVVVVVASVAFGSRDRPDETPYW